MIAPPISNLQQAGAFFMQEVIKGKGAITGYASAWALKAKDTTGRRYLILLKRDFFRTFARQFPQLPAEHRSIGQTITLETLTGAAQDQALVVTVMEGGAIYGCDAKKWLDFARMYNTIRKASTTPSATSWEASIPVKMLDRLNPE